MENESKGKRVFLMYGEQTTTVSYKVPLTKAIEIDSKIRFLLKEYENPKSVVLDSKFQKDVVGKIKKVVDRVLKDDLIPLVEMGGEVKVWYHPESDRIVDDNKNGLKKEKKIDSKAVIDIPESKELRPASEISNSKPIVLSELPKGAISYAKSTRFFHNQDQTKWYSKFYKGGVWEVLEFEDFEVCKKYVAETSASNINGKKK